MPTTSPFCRALWGLIALTIVAWSGCSAKEADVGDAGNAASAVAEPPASAAASPSPEVKPPSPDASVRDASPAALPPVEMPASAGKTRESSKSLPKWVTDFETPKAASPSQPESTRRRPAMASAESNRGDSGDSGLNPNPLRGGKGGGFELAPWAPPVAGQVPTQLATPTPTGSQSSDTRDQSGRAPPLLLPGGNAVKAADDAGKPGSVKVPSDAPQGAASVQVGPSSVKALSAQTAKPSDDSRSGPQRAPAVGESLNREGTRRPPIDPIKENGPIFVGWPKPKLALVITGREDGYLEPCGCAGLDRMKGGLSRRHTFVRQLHEQGWPLIVVDVGGISKGFGRQAQLKFHATAEAMKIIGYDAIGLGASELQLPADVLLSDTAGTPQQPSPFVSANVGLFGFDPSITPQKQVVERAGLKVGITSVLGKTYQKQINNPDIALADPEQTLAKIVPELKRECNLLILLAHATVDESIALSNRVPEFDVVVTAGGPAGEPPRALNRVRGARRCWSKWATRG